MAEEHNSTLKSMYRWLFTLKKTIRAVQEEQDATVVQPEEELLIREQFQDITASTDVVIRTKPLSAHTRLSYNQKVLLSAIYGDSRNNIPDISKANVRHIVVDDIIARYGLRSLIRTYEGKPSLEERLDDILKLDDSGLSKNERKRCRRLRIKIFDMMQSELAQVSKNIENRQKETAHKYFGNLNVNLLKNVLQQGKGSGVNWDEVDVNTLRDAFCSGLNMYEQIALVKLLGGDNYEQIRDGLTDSNDDESSASARATPVGALDTFRRYLVTKYPRRRI
jgi:hypothetical protein